MNRYWPTIHVLACTPLVLVCTLGSALAADGDGPIDFNRDIRPILSDKCFACHGPDNNRREAELRLDDPQDAMLDRDGHAVIVPGDVAKSELIARITSEDESERMPPADTLKQLSLVEVELLTRWISSGAKYETHWAYASLKRPKAPKPPKADAASAGPSGAIDRFLAELWTRNGVTPNGQADPTTLVRRLSFDLLGLPPTAEQVERFRTSPTDETWRSLVDEMLQSPHFGERMAVYWLDLVRYADSVGYHGDQEHAITPYRDYVIKSFNDNKPFDQFTLEQLAGDLLPDRTEEQLIGSGYNRVLQTSHEGGVQVQEYLTKYAADRVRNLSAVWLGATVGCAECHDHKYDPYTQRDFYSLAAFFADLDDVSSFKGGNTLPTKREPEAVVLSPIDAATLELVVHQLAELQKEADKNGVQIGELEERKEDLLTRRRRTMVSKSIEPRVTRILERGDWMDKNGEVVAPATPAFLPSQVTSPALPKADSDSDYGSDSTVRASRIDLARWLTSPDQPQTARVLANRLWYLYFGEGLSPNLDDSGSQGTPPISPELLDWLAMELVESGWDVKHTIRLIATSRAYRMSSVPTAESMANDPANVYFGRQNRFRLSAEFIRDTALHLGGLLNPEIGGPSSRPYQPAGYYAHLNFPTRTYKPDSDDRQFRRGVYVHWQRQFLHPMLRAFDAPTREECTAGRPTSNTPLAALTLLNDPTFVEAARGLAAVTIQEGPADPGGRITWMWKRVLNRAPDTTELEIVTSFHEQTANQIAQASGESKKILDVGIQPVVESMDKQELATWTAVARAVLNLNETVTRN